MVCISQRFVPYPVSFSRPPGTLQCKSRFYNHTRYDGLNRRITSHIDSGAPSNPSGIDTYVHCYYNSPWQILETRQSDTPSAQPENLQPKHQYVWSQRYIDAPVLRDENTGNDGLCDDVVDAFPQEVRYVLECLREVYRTDDAARRFKLSDEQRMRLHQRRSQPVMNTLHRWLNEQLVGVLETEPDWSGGRPDDSADGTNRGVWFVIPRIAMSGRSGRSAASV